MRLGALIVVAACSSPSKPAPVEPPPPPVPDAAVAPDAGVPADAATWRFRFSTKDRTETWSLRFGNGYATMDIELADRTAHYTGTMVGGASTKLEFSAGSARLSLDCKRSQRPLSSKCNDMTAKPIDVLDCYVPDFKEPMPFGEGQGVEYVVDPTCNGYRLIPPDASK